MSSSENKQSSVFANICQSCNIPTNCTLEATINFDGKTEIYRQEQHFFRRFTYLIEPKKGKTVPLKLMATPKGCISHNPNCPIGNVFNENGSLYGDFSPQKVFDDVLVYTKRTSEFSFGENNPISMLDSFIYRKGFTDDPRYRQRYGMRLSECGAAPFLTVPNAIKLLQVTLNPVTHGTALLFKEGKKHLASAQFDLILYREFKVSVEIGLESALEEKSNEARKAEQTANNVARGYRPTHSGWTKHTKKYGIKTGLGIKGEISSIIGDETVAFNTELKKEFLTNKNKLNLTNSIDTAFNKINSVLSSGNRVQYPLVSTEFCYPVLKIEGGIKTHQSSNYGVITQGNVSVGFAPLFGFQITVDLLTAFATYAHVDFVVNNAREFLEKNEEAVKEGNEGAYAKMVLELTFSCGLHGNFKFKTDDEGEFESDGRDIEIQGELIGNAHLEAGINYWGIQGFFEAGAEIAAKLNIAFDKEKGDDLTVVIYHEGIKAKVYAKYGVGKDKDKNKNNKDLPTSIKPGVYQEWIIYEALNKDESDWRFTLG
ncbi:hypothetical protein [Providencia rettgeri]|uniref:hypothetical protein n=1 Tax=Providencia rettgeri TaxID=587 RepID=UPI002048FADD|nr:hypothetical protein [Providencia rettgeri]UPS63995.1 hypothetical protein M0M83_05570 [Providencia rettgeri]